LIVVPPNIV